ncbi:MAG TPA: coproporphyrinogen III oxidase family protein, partial [Deinococcales bacterium]|nr:coproporphyrinogen III oxidase family protein [Deinococcales bacterium]
ELPIEHLSAYTLTIEEGTPFHRRGVTVAEEAEERALETADRVLPELGFTRYEVSNFARPGAESRHNLAYWRNWHYYGLGPGASGHYPAATSGPGGEGDTVSTRVKNPPLGRWLEGERGPGEPVTRLDWLTDALYAGLRLVGGVDVADLSARAGLDLLTVRGEAIERLTGKGWLASQGTNLRATPAGLWVLNRVVAELL